MSGNKKDKSESGAMLFLKKNKKAVIAIAGTVLVVGISAGAYVGMVSSKVAEWEGKIYPGVEVYGVELDGLTKEEATKTLNNELKTIIGDQEIKINIGDKSYNLKYSEISPSFDTEAIVKQAIDYGKDKEKFEKYSLIKEGSTKDIELIVSYDEKKLDNKIEEIAKEVDIEPKNATFSFNGGDFATTPEVIGKKLDTKEVKNKVLETIKNTEQNEGKEIILDFKLKDAKPQITQAALKKIDGKVAGYGSPYLDNGDTGRLDNMRLATEFINGALVMPGETLSYNQLVGDTTPERGFALANAYVNGKVKKEYGGGICQVSTALYRAARRANLGIEERVNHMMIVGYSEPGLDATVFTPSPDLIIKNTYDFPIYVQGYMDSTHVGFNIYGNKEGFGTNTYELVNANVTTIPAKTVYEDNPNLPQGTEKTVTNPMNGATADAYLVTYDANGNEIDRVHVSSDYYQPLNRIVERGTGKKAN